MTETEIQKLFAYQYGLLNNNLVLPNITMGSPGARYEADLIYINKRRYVSKVRFCDIRRSRKMTKQDFIEMIENMPDDAELVVSNYTIGFVVTDVEYDELWNQIRLSGE